MNISHFHRLLIVSCTLLVAVFLFQEIYDRPDPLSEESKAKKECDSDYSKIVLIDGFQRAG